MTTSSNINLKVPFGEKDQAKSLGARWNAELKLWYVPQGVDAAPLAKWFTDSPAPTSAPAPTKNAAKPSAKLQTSDEQPSDDDMDAINAKLRDAYELREVDEW